MLQLQEAGDELDRLEVQTLVVTFEGREAAREYLDETGLVWPLLVDTDRRLYHAYHMQKARLRHLWGFATMRAYAREALQGRFPRIPRADTVQQGGNLGAYGLFELASGRAKSVPDRIKSLAEIKAAMMVGCPF